MIELDFKKTDGLIPVIVQEHSSGEILMLAYMNQTAWEATLRTREATYYSRSRNTLWVKGKTSGNIQKVKDILIDCDNDTVLLKVDQIGGAACHTGYKSCFYRRVEDGKTRVIASRIFDPKEVYGE